MTSPFTHALYCVEAENFANGAGRPHFDVGRSPNVFYQMRFASVIGSGSSGRLHAARPGGTAFMIVNPKVN